MFSQSQTKNHRTPERTARRRKMTSSPSTIASPPKQASVTSPGVSGSTHVGSRTTKKARKDVPGSPIGEKSGQKSAAGGPPEQVTGPKKTQAAKKKSTDKKKYAAPSKSKGKAQPRSLDSVDFFDTIELKRALKIKHAGEIMPHSRKSTGTVRAWGRMGPKQRDVTEIEVWDKMSLEEKVAAIKEVPRGGSTDPIPVKWSRYVGQLERKRAREKQKADAAAAKEEEKRARRDSQASLGRGQAGGSVAKPPSKSGGGDGGRKSVGGYTKKGTRPTEAVHAGEAPALKQEGRAMMETAVEVKMMTYKGRKSGDPENIPVHISFHGVVESEIGGGVKSNSKTKAKKKQLRIVGPDHKSTRKAVKAALIALDELENNGTDGQTEIEADKFKLTVFFDDGDGEGDITKKVETFTKRREVDKGGVKTSADTTEVIAANGTGKNLATPSKRRGARA